MKFQFVHVLAFMILITWLGTGCDKTDNGQSDTEKVDEICLKNRACRVGDGSVPDGGMDANDLCGDYFSSVDKEVLDCVYDCSKRENCDNWLPCVDICEGVSD